ncbi:hypothetical protein Hden_2063 [Hyphomicrobium denitrificans ATCC 51888]|uniref:Uncharacterized protein n=1 Tax=Hyphomicrobium denitrificans (strain ATCC 51888 / DSM 1869 / NCIMB 11706 / TK 0415) TaxID=582899 RepID=D8JPY0_HYPDA|nr:hypothetical protein Hden_2063 [Hyphomicrobium denitrificans ATCC 51888]
MEIQDHPSKHAEDRLRHPSTLPQNRIDNAHPGLLTQRVNQLDDGRGHIRDAHLITREAGPEWASPQRTAIIAAFQP